MTDKGHLSSYTRVKIEKCHDAIEEDGVSSNAPKVWIGAKLRHTQGSRERGDMSVEDTLEEG